MEEVLAYGSDWAKFKVNVREYQSNGYQVVPGSIAISCTPYETEGEGLHYGQKVSRFREHFFCALRKES